MSLLVVTAFTGMDYKLAVGLYEWIGKLGGIKNNDVLLVTDPELNAMLANRVLLAAKHVAKSVKRILTSVKHDRKWPQGPNAAFIAAARYAKDNGCAFLWLEPDCVPTKVGWLDAIEVEYAKAGKRYMGEIVAITQPNGKKISGMMGIGVYPKDVDHLDTLPMSVPFDLHIGIRTLKDTHPSKAFQWFGGPGNKRTPPTSLENIRQGTMVFHADKKGVLIGLLRSTPQSVLDKPKSILIPTQSTVAVKHESDMISVVITSHGRINRLKTAHQSCVDAKVREVIITASGYSPTDQRTVAGIAGNVRGTITRVVFNESCTSNDSWIRGLESCSGPWCHILHDDDKLLPDFLGGLKPGLAHAFQIFPAKFHRDSKPHDGLCDGPFVGRGIVSTNVLYDSLMVGRSLAITPVRGLFRKQDLLQWLKEAGSELPEQCMYRPDFLVGNDLWIYLGASTKYKSFYSGSVPLVSLGCDADSCTTSDASTSKNLLPVIYDLARSAFQSFIRDRLENLKQTHLHIVTIVLDGAPFLMAQLGTFNKLRIPWTWSIVEGVAGTTADTSWCRMIPGRFSSDGTHEILDSLRYHPNIRIFQNMLWKNKTEMVNAPLVNSTMRPCVLMQIDCDEFWTSTQLETIAQLMWSKPDHDHAMFWCNYFVGPGLVMRDRNCFANNPTQDWRRAWNWKPGKLFITHEPPVMTEKPEKFIGHNETESLGLVFDHYAYSLKSQVEFKQRYYGYDGAVEKWEHLQKSVKPRQPLSKHFVWMKNAGKVHGV